MTKDQGTVPFTIRAPQGVDFTVQVTDSAGNDVTSDYTFTAVGYALDEVTLKQNTPLGDWWHVARVWMAEHIICLALAVMPRGPEKKQLERQIYEYVLWAEQK